MEGTSAPPPATVAGETDSSMEQGLEVEPEGVSTSVEMDRKGERHGGTGRGDAVRLSARETL
jgi:hypothetical protein